MVGRVVRHPIGRTRALRSRGHAANHGRKSATVRRREPPRRPARGRGGPARARPAGAAPGRGESAGEGEVVDPLLPGGGAGAPGPLGHEARRPRGDPRRVPADRDDRARALVLRAPAAPGEAGASPDARPLGPPRDQRPQRRGLLRADRAVADRQWAADHEPVADELPADRGGPGEAPADGPRPPRLRPHARLDEQPRVVPPRPGRRLPRGASSSRSSPATPASRATGSPAWTSRASSRWSASAGAGRCSTRSARRWRRMRARMGSTPTIARRSRWSPAPRPAARSTSRRSRRPSASGTGSTPATIASARPASSAACPTWASACSWPAA